MIDSSCQMNLVKGNSIQAFYSEKGKKNGVEIKGTLVQLKGRFINVGNWIFIGFPINIGGIKLVLHLKRLGDIK